MRNEIVWTTGRFLSEEHGGRLAHVALGHVLRSTAEFGIAVDTFEEDCLALERQREADQELMRTSAREERVDTDAGPETRTFHYLPGNFGDAARYWERRQLLHAKAGALALDQLQRGLTDFASASGLQIGARAVELDAAFPALRPIRNSVSHANERAQGNTPRREPPRGVIRMTDLLSNIGYCEGTDFVMRVAEGPTDAARLAISEGSYTTALTIVQDLVLQMPWRHRLEKAEPMLAPLVG